jgi:hypothetical protein
MKNASISIQGSREQTREPAFNLMPDLPQPAFEKNCVVFLIRLALAESFFQCDSNCRDWNTNLKSHI